MFVYTCCIYCLNIIKLMNDHVILLSIVSTALLANWATYYNYPIVPILGIT